MNTKYIMRRIDQVLPDIAWLFCNLVPLFLFYIMATQVHGSSGSCSIVAVTLVAIILLPIILIGSALLILSNMYMIMRAIADRERLRARFYALCLPLGGLPVILYAGLTLLK